MIQQWVLNNAAAATRYAMGKDLLARRRRTGTGPEHGSREAGASPEQTARSYPRTRTQN
jgi:hypothetical protein